MGQLITDNWSWTTDHDGQLIMADDWSYLIVNHIKSNAVVVLSDHLSSIPIRRRSHCSIWLSNSSKVNADRTNLFMMDGFIRSIADLMKEKSSIAAIATRRRRDRASDELLSRTELSKRYFLWSTLYDQLSLWSVIPWSDDHDQLSVISYPMISCPSAKYNIAQNRKTFF